jgi:hypothetical protein
MQRVRMSLPYLRECGWEPYVLAVAPTGDQPTDALLTKTGPADISIRRVKPSPLALSSRLGIGNIALRALPSLYRAGAQLIAEHGIDVVYFSTTMFFSMPLGRLWRRRFGVPYVLDIQDPWLSDYYEEHPGSRRPPKYAAARSLHAILEPWTMKRVSALIAVSESYLTTLRRRYPWLTEDMCTTLPFGASRRDFEFLDANPQPNRVFQKEPGVIRGVYVGRAGDDMKPALQILFAAFRSGIELTPETFASVMLHFVGTDYAADARARQTVAPVAQQAGVGACVSERVARVPYFEGLQLLKDADFLVLISSDDPAYTPSKAYPYLMAGKPILAVLHERSSLLPVLRESRAATVITFSDGGREKAVEALLHAWRRMMGRLGSPMEPDARLLHRFSAPEMARRQCAVFNRVARARTDASRLVGSRRIAERER